MYVCMYEMKTAEALEMKTAELENSFHGQTLHCC